MPSLMCCLNPLIVGLLFMQWILIMVRCICAHPLSLSKHASANIIIACLPYFLKNGVHSFGELQKLFYLTNIYHEAFSWPKVSLSLSKMLTLKTLKIITPLQRIIWTCCPLLVRDSVRVVLIINLHPLLIVFLPEKLPPQLSHENTTNIGMGNATTDSTGSRCKEASTEVTDSSLSG